MPKSQNAGVKLTNKKNLEILKFVHSIFICEAEAFRLVWH